MAYIDRPNVNSLEFGGDIGQACKVDALWISYVSILSRLFQWKKIR